MRDQLRARPRLAVYLRTSTDGQQIGENIHRQVGSFRQWWGIHSAEYTLIHRFSDASDADSFFIDDGFNLETWKPGTAFCDLMTRCINGEVDCIFVSEMDRLFRSKSAELRGKIKDILDVNDIKVLTKTGQVAVGLYTELMSAIGAEDKRSIQYKTQEGKIMRARRESRPPSGQVPFGYRYNKFKCKWEVLDDEAVIVKSIYALSSGLLIVGIPPEIAAIVASNPLGISDPDIVKAIGLLKFSLTGYYERLGRRKSIEKNPEGLIKIGFVQSLFKNARYTGTMHTSLKDPSQVGKQGKNSKSLRHEIAFEVPAIILKENYDRAINIRKKRQIHAKRNVNHEYLCKGLVKCHHCSTNLSARPKWADKIRKTDGAKVTYAPSLYYTCPKKVRADGTRCRYGKCHSAKRLDQLVWQELSSTILNPVQAKMISCSQDDRQQIQKNIDQLHAAINSVKTKKDGLSLENQRLTTLVVKGLLLEDDFERERQRINGEQSKIEKSLRKFTEQLRQLEENRAKEESVDITAITRKYRKRLTELTFEERRSLALILVDAIYVEDNGDIRIQLKRFC